MSEPTRPKDPAALWKEQPEEKLAVNLEQIVNLRTEQLHASTRSEILMSIGATLLLVCVTLLRFGPARNPTEEVGCGLIVVWLAITLCRLRSRIWGPVRPDAAATGVEYYRQELERRRDHLRDAWLWHGPLFLACLILAGVWSGWRFLSYTTLYRVLPLVTLLAIWTGYGLWRRLRLAKELQREIDEIALHGAPPPPR